MDINRLNRLQANFSAASQSILAAAFAGDNDQASNIQNLGINPASTTQSRDQPRPNASATTGTSRQTHSLGMPGTSSTSSGFRPIRSRPEVAQGDLQLLNGLQSFSRSGVSSSFKKSKIITLLCTLLPGPRTNFSKQESQRYKGTRSHFYNIVKLKMEPTRENMYVRAVARHACKPLLAVTERDFDFYKQSAKGTFHKITNVNPTAEEILQWRIRDSQGVITGGKRSRIYIMPKTELTSGSSEPPTSIAPAAVSTPTSIAPAAVSTPTSIAPAAVSTPTSIAPAAVSTPTSIAPAAVSTPTSIAPAAVSTPTSIAPPAVSTPTSIAPPAVSTPTSIAPAAVSTPTSIPPVAVSTELAVMGNPQSATVTSAVPRTNAMSSTVPSVRYEPIISVNQPSITFGGDTELNDPHAYDGSFDERIGDFSQDQDIEDETQPMEIGASLQNIPREPLHNTSNEALEDEPVVFNNELQIKLELHLTKLLSKFTQAKDYVATNVPATEGENSISDILSKLKLPSDTGMPTNCININKQSALKQTMAALLSGDIKPNRRLNVKFNDEIGIDNGALTDVLMEQCKAQLAALSIFTSADDGLRLNYDRKAYDNNQYMAAGRILSYMLAIGNVLPQVMSPFLYALVAFGRRKVNPQLHDLQDVRLQRKVFKILQCDTKTTLQAIKIELCELLNLAGCMAYDSATQIVNGLLRFHTIDVHRDALDQFVEGLEWCNLNIADSPTSFEQLFVATARCSLSVDVLKNIYTYQFAFMNKAKKAKESFTVKQFMVFLKDLEAEDKVDELLEFWTGKKNVPLLGFNPELSVEFRHMDGVAINDPSRDYPKANACAHQLLLPVGHKTTFGFLKAMNFAVLKYAGRHIFDDR